MKWSKGLVVLRVESSRGISALCLYWCPWAFCKWRYVVNLSRRVKGQLTKGSSEFMSRSFLKYITTLKNLVTIDILIVEICFIICHLTACLKGYVNSWVEALHSKSPFGMFGGNWRSASGDERIKYLACHMTLQDHVIEVSRNVMVGTSHSKLPHSQIWWPYPLLW